MKWKILIGIVAIFALFGIALVSGVHVNTHAAVLDSSSGAQTQGDPPPLDYDYIMIYHAQLLDDPPPLDYDYI